MSTQFETCRFLFKLMPHDRGMTYALVKILSARKSLKMWLLWVLARVIRIPRSPSSSRIRNLRPYLVALPIGERTQHARVA